MNVKVKVKVTAEKKAPKRRKKVDASPERAGLKKASVFRRNRAKLTAPEKEEPTLATAKTEDSLSPTEETAADPLDDSLDRLKTAFDGISPQFQPEESSLTLTPLDRTESGVGDTSPRYMRPTRSSRARSPEHTEEPTRSVATPRHRLGPALSQAERLAAQQRLSSAESVSIRKRQGALSPVSPVAQTPTRPTARVSHLRYLSTPVVRTVELEPAELSGTVIPRAERLKAQERLLKPPPLLRRSPTPPPENENTGVASVARLDAFASSRVASQRTFDPEQSLRRKHPEDDVEAPRGVEQKFAASLAKEKLRTCTRPAATPKRAVLSEYTQRPGCVVVDWRQKEATRDVRAALLKGDLRVVQMRHELTQRHWDHSGNKLALEGRLAEALEADLQCEVELRSGAWQRATIEAIGENVTLQVKRRKPPLELEKTSARLRQHLVAPRAQSFSNVEDSERAEVAYRLHRDALWRQENFGRTAEEERHRSGLTLGLPPESLPLSRCRGHGNGGRPTPLTSRVDLKSQALVDGGDSTDEDEPLFLERPAATAGRAISRQV